MIRAAGERPRLEEQSLIKKGKTSVKKRPKIGASNVEEKAEKTPKKKYIKSKTTQGSAKSKALTSSNLK